MNLIFNIAIFVVVGIAIVIIYLKFGNRSAGLLSNLGGTTSSGGNTYENKMPELAAFLGLSYKNIAPPSDKKTFMNTGDKIFGKYRDVEVEIVMSATARESDHTPLLATYAYDFSSTKYFAFKVNNSGNKSFNILPKNKNLIANPTGINSFDSSLSYTGDAIVPKTYLEFIGSMNWMDLSLRNNVLLFNDSFSEHIINTKGSMAMMSAVHPVWNTSAKNFQIDFNNVKAFLDKIIDLIEEMGMKA
ncbi:MAG: hypothetical protein HY959_00345 [Ignavibacteriae bacterium]|nr:hypothetical protein [Ignavibacteriota bacterium]